MKNNLTIILATFLAIFYTSCSEFCEGECFEDPMISMRILSRADSTDLVFGETKLYPFNDIKVFIVSQLDTTFLMVDSFFLGTAQIDNYLIFENRAFTISTVLIEFGDSDIDTLDFAFKSSECCGNPFSYLNTATQNNVRVYNHDTGSSFVTLFK